MNLESFSTNTPSQENGDHLYHQGMQAAQTGDDQRALSLLQQAMEALPQRGDIAYNYGVLLQQAGRIDDAIATWQRASKHSPQHSVIWTNLALALTLSGQWEKAQETYTQALALHPQCRDLLYHYALFLNKMGNLDQSLATFKTLLDATPQDQAALMNAGKTAKAAGQFSQAVTYYDRAINSGGPHTALAYFNRANLLLLQGQWRNGFTDYEWRLKLSDAPPAPWGLPSFHDSLPRGSRLLLWSDQGLGDALMFLRFAPLLAARGYAVFLFVQTPLKTLLTGSLSVQGVFDPTDAPVPMDAALAIGSLPHILQCDPVTSWQGPYIVAPPIPSSPLPPRGTSQRIGLVWAGNPKHENDRNRSSSLQDIAPLLNQTDTEWFSLQVGSRAEDIAKEGFQNRIVDLSESLTDFAVSAAVIRDLDLIITVDTAIAHLAGAMGKPVWTLLPKMNGDWRWGPAGETTFWYPSMRLYRQKQAGSWAESISEMGKDLHKTKL
ncbi:MAG: tetratricopeptide repeat-containing glycosyltransferase family protein [Alphaproteobacteria bacterium]|nr:tetratricopeptide repeat-containing glycosyltransferase family protein [Alphaproteobacteria bacterium]